MSLLTILALFAGGVLAASNLIVGRQPNSRSLIGKLQPYQGLIGIVLLISGVLDAFRLVGSLGVVGPRHSWGLIYLVSTFVELALGFLLSYGLIGRLMLGRARERSEQIRARLEAYQG